MADVAIIIPAYNPEACLVEAVESALAQSADLELVVVDDGSTPGRFPELPHDERLRVVRQANSGVSVARNNGVHATSAPLVAFLDADDRWLPGKLERQIQALRDHPDAVGCCTNYHCIGLTGERIADGWNDGGTAYPDILIGNPMAISAVVVRRDAFVETGGFDAFHSVLADYDLWLRLAALGGFVRVPASLVEYRVGPHFIGQMSGDPLTTYREIESMYQRHALRAARLHDETLVAAIAAGRKNMAAIPARQAADRFADSMLAGKPDWQMLSAALRMAGPRAFSRVAGRLTSRTSRALVRRVRP